MLKQLSVENFTVFAKADFEFAPGLNVIVGENGTGKSHVLKLAYAAISIGHHTQWQDMVSTDFEKFVGYSYSNKIKAVFKPQSLSALARKNVDNNDDGFFISYGFDNNRSNVDIRYDFAQVNKASDFSVEKIPQKGLDNRAVFIPTRELLSIYPGFVSMYEARYLEFEETYRDTCLLLGEPLLKKPMADLMSVLEGVMGGKVKLENDRFYLLTPAQGKLEITLVAEGLRKLAMLAQLIAVGALEKDGYLFWDEPEANLNPRLVKVVAKVICDLVSKGVQVFIATHSYFLLKEIQIISGKQQPIDTRYFSLLKNNDGVEVESANSLDDLQSIVTLEEELAQFDREQEAYDA